MRRPAVLLAVILLPVLIAPGWSGDERVELLGEHPSLTVRPVALYPGDPARRRLGALTYLGGVDLRSRDPAFGGYSALAVRGDRFTLVSDDANVVRFTMTRGRTVRDVRFGQLPAGPRTGWNKRERDSESLTVDPATGTVWIGFEGFNQIWRYDPTLRRAEAGVAPAAMARWRANGGIESLARLGDGRFVAISESVPYGDTARAGLVWPGDPVASPAPSVRFRYIPAPHFDPVDMAQLPDGRLLVLERRFALPFRWSSRLVVIDPATLAEGATVRGREIARLAAPAIHDNFEGVAVARDGAATIIRLVSDDNRLPLQRTLLLTFRLDD